MEMDMMDGQEDEMDGMEYGDEDEDQMLDMDQGQMMEGDMGDYGDEVSTIFYQFFKFTLTVTEFNMISFAHYRMNQ